MSMARAWSSCLNTTRLATCSPVGDGHRRHRARGSGPARGCRPGWSAPRSRPAGAGAAPGSRRSRPARPTPGWRPARWRCRRRPSPRAIPSLRMSSSSRRPDLELDLARIRRLRLRRRARPAGRRSSRASPACCRVGRVAVALQRRDPLRPAVQAPRSSRSSASSRVSASVEVAEVDQVDELSGDRSASSRHSGLPASRAARSQQAFSTAPMAMCTTPRSGPSQRSGLSPTSRRDRPPGRCQVAGDLVGRPGRPGTAPARAPRRAGRRCRRRW